MTPDPGSAREAAERTAQAIMAGNLARVMNDITPAAFSQVMQLGQAQATAGGAPAPSPFAPGTMPSITGYEIEEIESSPESGLFHVTFTSPAGTATLAARWQLIMGLWKIADVGLIEANPANPPAG